MTPICPRCSAAPLGNPDGPLGLLFPPTYNSLTGWSRSTYACTQRVAPWTREDQQHNPYQRVVCGAAMMRPAMAYEGPQENRRARVIRSEIPPITAYTTQFDPTTGLLIPAEPTMHYDYLQYLAMWQWLREARHEVASKHLDRYPDWWHDVTETAFRVFPGDRDDPRGKAFVNADVEKWADAYIRISTRKRTHAQTS